MHMHTYMQHDLLHSTLTVQPTLLNTYLSETGLQDAIQRDLLHSALTVQPTLHLLLVEASVSDEQQAAHT